MRKLLSGMVLAGWMSTMLPSWGCNATFDAMVDINATVRVTTTADVNNVMQGQAIPMTVQVTNVYLVEPSATPPAQQASTAGHLRVYLDDVDDAALLVTAQTSFNVTIPPSTSPGPHKIICRVHRHDGTPTTTTFDLNINVRGQVSSGD